MSMTLNLVDHLLFRAHNLQRHGQNRAAAELFTRLGRLRELPDDVAEEVQVCLAEICIELEDYRQARRHLVAAIARRPDCAHYHYLMAVVAEDDPHGNAKQAVAHYRRCLELDAEHPDYQCDFGIHAIQQGRKRAGMAALRRAAALGADEPELLGRVAAGMRDAERADEARDLLRAALFRHPRDRRFRDLLDRHQFSMLHRAQQPQNRQDTARDTGAVLLPFRRPKQRAQKSGGKTIRIDGPEKLTGPKILPLHAPRKKDA